MTIPLETLRSVKQLYTHANCPDGVASALVVKDALPDVRVHFVKYGSKEHRAICPEDGVLFCDFSPYLPKEGVTEHVGPLLHGTREMMVELWRRAGALVLDHHTRDVVEPYGELGVFGENDKLECGAMLAFKHVWFPLYLENRPKGSERADAVLRFAEIAAVRDTWKRDDPRFQEACEQAAALVFWGFDKLNLDNMLDYSVWMRLGKHLLEKQLESARTAISESCCFTSARGTRVLVFQGVSATSDAAEILEQDFKEATVPGPILGSISNRVFPPSNPDLVVGFHYRTDAGKLQLQFSTRSHVGFDCQALARAHGGNGHAAAAGFTVSEGLTANPYDVFRILLELWEAGR